jgi:hypothetical protein
MEKLYRVYYNRSSDAPLVWSVDEGTQETEINVARVSLHFCDVETIVNLKETVNPDETPKAWLQVRGVLRVEGGTAIIEGYPIGEIE